MRDENESVKRCRTIGFSLVVNDQWLVPDFRKSAVDRQNRHIKPSGTPVGTTLVFFWSKQLRFRETGWRWIMDHTSPIALTLALAGFYELFLYPINAKIRQYVFNSSWLMIIKSLWSSSPQVEIHWNCHAEVLELELKEDEAWRCITFMGSSVDVLVDVRLEI